MVKIEYLKETDSIKLTLGSKPSKILTKEECKANSRLSVLYGIVYGVSEYNDTSLTD